MRFDSLIKNVNDSFVVETTFLCKKSRIPAVSTVKYALETVGMLQQMCYYE